MHEIQTLLVLERASNLNVRLSQNLHFGGIGQSGQICMQAQIYEHSLIDKILTTTRKTKLKGQ